MFKSPSCKKLYDSLLSQQISWRGKILIMRQKRHLSKINLEEECQTADIMSMINNYETFEQPEYFYDTNMQMITLTINYDVERAIEFCNMHKNRIVELPVQKVKNQDWARMVIQKMYFAEKTQTINRNISHKTNYLIVCVEPIFNTLTLIDGNHRLIEALNKRKKTINVFFADKSESIDFLMPESKKLATVFQSLGCICSTDQF